ncbi:hypothetical protein GON01_15015 [Sphingomonas sp. MAH-20]|uniref:DUF2927 domain-containing protein n=1 Tax=Sphingomonas horti TaxID=2682842 RepID=A0A6I4J8U5_9SPHN|nr:MULTISPECIES: hypothetical protein [Sphingomonas]MBA2919208.1 hypothetical protein [Sphingomonas sp. CGMCC 1.13658]MVO79241.1 hypothetical protein [Sphingomonas horti]
MLISLLFLVAQSAAPQAGRAADAAPAAGDPTIVVEGTAKTDAQIRTEAKTFVRAVAAAPDTSDQLARWNEAICPKVIGALPDEEKPILERIREVAKDAGIKLSKRKHCDPNILVAFTSDPSGVVREVFEKQPHRARSIPVAARSDLISGAYPVRWWYDLKLEGRYGEAPIGDNPALLNALDTTRGSVSMGKFAQSENQAGNVADYSSSLIGTKSRQSIGAATIVIDVNRVKKLSHDALASYVAMVALAPLKLPPKPVPTPTITNLFRETPDDRAEDLTEWDRAYLAALYKVAANRSADNQRSSMTATIARHMRGDQ